MPKALVVRFSLKPGAAEGFDQLMTETVAQIRTEEPGTWVYVVHSVDGQPDQRIFYELYKDDDAFAFHNSQPYIRHFLEGREQYLTATHVDFGAPVVAAGIPALTES
jgi:quinol monooxygenase YgiN